MTSTTASVSGSAQISSMEQTLKGLSALPGRTNTLLSSSPAAFCSISHTPTPTVPYPKTETFIVFSSLSRPP